jgi:hypothetical protein
VADVRVIFNLHVGGADGTTLMRLAADLPFAPRKGDHFVFCPDFCCAPGLAPCKANPPFYRVAEGCWDVTLFDDDCQGSMNEKIAHYAACGFVEVVSCRELYTEAEVASNLNGD